MRWKKYINDQKKKITQTGKASYMLNKELNIVFKKLL